MTPLILIYCAGLCSGFGAAVAYLQRRERNRAQLAAFRSTLRSWPEIPIWYSDNVVELDAFRRKPQNFSA